MMLTIPKTIHYCWFGGKPLPASAKKCVKSWKKYCPDYNIIEWNERNFDIQCNYFCKKMAEEKKWAFISDYARLKIVYEYGGIYLDTDVELIRSLDDLLKYKAFMGFQDSKEVNTGLGFGSVRKQKFIKENMNYYEKLSENFTPIACPNITTKLLRAYGLMDDCGKIQQVADIMIFPVEYFCPKSERTGLIEKTGNTFSIHHFDASWFSDDWKKGQQRRWKREKRRYILHTPNRCFRKWLGLERYSKIKKLFRRQVNENE